MENGGIMFAISKMVEEIKSEMDKKISYDSGPMYQTAMGKCLAIATRLEKAHIAEYEKFNWMPAWVHVHDDTTAHAHTERVSGYAINGWIVVPKEATRPCKWARRGGTLDDRKVYVCSNPKNECLHDMLYPCGRVPLAKYRKQAGGPI